MMDLDFVQSLIKALDESGLDSIEIERGGTRIRLAKTPSASGGATVEVHRGSAPAPVPMGSPPAPAVAPEGHLPSSESASGDSGLIEITSPMVAPSIGPPLPMLRPTSNWVTPSRRVTHFVSSRP